jgi:hypothetical protein
VELYFHSPIRLHGVVLSLKKAQGQPNLYLYLYLYLTKFFYVKLGLSHKRKKTLKVFEKGVLRRTVDVGRRK